MVLKIKPLTNLNKFIEEPWRTTIRYTAARQGHYSTHFLIRIDQELFTLVSVCAICFPFSFLLTRYGTIVSDRDCCLSFLPFNLLCKLRASDSLMAQT